MALQPWETTTCCSLSFLSKQNGYSDTAHLLRLLWGVTELTQRAVRFRMHRCSWNAYVFTLMCLLVTWQCQQNPHLEWVPWGVLLGQEDEFYLSSEELGALSLWLSTLGPRLSCWASDSKLTPSSWLTLQVCMHGEDSKKLSGKPQLGEQNSWSTDLRLPS